MFHVPKEIKQFVRSIMSLITFDAPSIISSPRCEWNFDIGLEYAFNMCIPLMFGAFFVVWCWCVRQYYRQNKKIPAEFNKPYSCCCCVCMDHNNVCVNDGAYNDCI